MLTVRCSAYSDRAELDSRSLLNYRDGAFVKDIARIRAELEDHG